MKKFITILCILPFIGGCLDIKLDNQFTTISTVDMARELLASAYNSLPRYQVEFAVLSDDFKPTAYSSAYAELDNLYNWQDNAIDNLSSQLWTDYYMTIAYLNTLLTRLDEVELTEDGDAVELDKVRSEAQALKAYCYFDLLRIYAPRYAEENLDRDGIILNTGREALNVRAGFNRSFFDDKLTISANIYDAFTVQNTVSTEDVMFATLVTNPTEPVYQPSGEYSVFVDSVNPVKLVNEYRSTSRWNDILTSGKITYSPIEPLTFTVTGGFHHFGNIDGSYATRKFDLNYAGQAWRESSMNMSKIPFEVLDKIDVLDERSRKLLYRTLYANVISSMEAYLSDRLIQKVLSSEETKRKFVEGFKDYKDEKIAVSDIFKHLENLDYRIIKTLREIIYHNLPRVKNIYNSVLGIRSCFDFIR